jgi:hypothetical protein
MPQHDDDLGPTGGIGSNSHHYGGRSRSARNRSLRPSHEAQIQIALDTIKEEAGQQPLNSQQIAHRLRLFLRDEYDVFLSEDEACKEVQKRQS